MSTERYIQIAVAKADLIICSVLKHGYILLILFFVFLLCVYGFCRYMEECCYPFFNDYVWYDVTSEGDD